MGFQGFVNSDFDALQGPGDIAAGAGTGTPTTALDGALSQAIASSQVSQARLNDAVLPILRSEFAHGLLTILRLSTAGREGYGYGATGSATLTPLPARVVSSDDQNALKIAENGIVLLQNGGTLLPLSRRSAGKVAGSATTVRWSPGTDPLSFSDTLADRLRSRRRSCDRRRARRDCRAITSSIPPSKGSLT